MPAFDAHLHVFGSVDEGVLAQGGERLAGFAGVLDELQALLDRGRVVGAMAASALPVEIWRRFLAGGWPDDEVDERLLRRAVEQNTTLVRSVSSDDRVVVAVGAEAVLPADGMLAHLREAAADASVRAIKVHPALNFVAPDHPGYTPIYDFAVEAGLPVVAHGGTSEGTMYADPAEYCAPERFRPVVEAFPDLRLVVAHLGQPFFDDLAALMDAHRNVLTDLSLVLGIGVLHGPDLARVIRTVGVERVLFGSDFPYFDPEAGLDVLEGAGLSPAELEAVSHGNAQRLLSG